MGLPSLDEILAFPNLPTLPAVAAELIELTNQPDVGIPDVAEVVKHDPALTARILKTVNASYYGLSKPCATIDRAMGYLGLNAVKSLVLGFSLSDLSRRHDEGIDLVDFWRRCLFSAAAAKRVAAATERCDPETAFVSALLQDIGMLALDTALGHQYASVVATENADHTALTSTEQRVLGFHHGEAGARLGEQWALPGSIVEPIRLHHEFDTPQTARDPVVHTVALGYEMYNLLAGSDTHAAWTRVGRTTKYLLGLDREKTTDLINEIRGDALEIARLLSVEVGEIPELANKAQEALEALDQRAQQETQSLRELNEQLTQAAQTDALTRVGNRAAFDDRLTSLFEPARNMKGALALVMIDADKFKSLNDTYGHQAGDQVLIELARRLNNNVAGPGRVYRYGGEEFAAIIPGCDTASASKLSERLRLAICQSPFAIGHDTGELTVSVSLGVAVLEPATSAVLTSPAHLIKAADRALYAAKEGGRNCSRVFAIRAKAA